MDAAESSEAPALPMRATVWKEVLASGMSPGTRVSEKAQHLTRVLTRAFVMEAWHRAAAEAAASHADTVDAEHLERIMPQLLLDFGP